MIENVLVGLLVGCASAVFGIIFWGYFGYKITARNLRREIMTFLQNDLPHIVEDEEFRANIRKAFRLLLREGGAALLEEVKRMKEEQ